MKKLAAYISTTVLAVSIFGISHANKAQAVTFPGTNGQIVFRTFGEDELYRVDADGLNQIQLTNTSDESSAPRWSPDGTQIVFDSDRSGDWEVYVMDADGSNQTSLTPGLGNNFEPQWSPDGTQIIFETTRDGDNEIYVMDADGSNQVNLTNDGDTDELPQWSADGNQIVFVSDRDGNEEIYVMDADGSNQTRLTNNAWTDYYPHFSPDNNQIVFHGNDIIYTVNADGSGLAPLTVAEATFDHWYPVFSPDGTKIAFSRQSTNSDDAYLGIMNPNGTGLQFFEYSSEGFVMVDPYEPYAIVWSPDSSQLVLTGYHDISLEESNLFIVNSDGSFVEQITTHGEAGWASWQAIPIAPTPTPTPTTTPTPTPATPTPTPSQTSPSPTSIATESQSELPETGASTRWSLWLGLALIASGAILHRQERAQIKIKYQKTTVK